MPGSRQAAERLRVYEGGAHDEPPERPGLSRMIERAADGDADAVAAVLRQLGPFVARTVAGVLGPSDPELEDATQDALLAVCSALPAFRGDASPRWFATRVASKVAVTALRRRMRQRAIAAAVHPSAGQSPARARRVALLRRALAKLPPAQAQAIALRWILGHSLPEIAAITGAPANTVRSRIRLARQALHDRLRSAPGWADILQPEPGGTS